MVPPPRYQGGQVRAIGVLLSLILLSAQVHAERIRAPQTQSEFCAFAVTPEKFHRLAEDSWNHMAFRNSGGLFDGGVCWWHSLFQRAAWYLTVYRPDLPKPSLAQAKFIVHQIARGKEVVEIPGFANFFEFSNEHQTLIQKKLEQWQITDGVLKFAWIHGLLAPGSLPPEEMSTHMYDLATQVNETSEIQWVMWQVPGIGAHSSLFLRVHETTEGSRSDIVDSNVPGMIDHLSYREGSSNIQTYLGPMVPHLGRQKDLRKFATARAHYCAQGPRVHTLSERVQILNEPLDNDWD